VAVGSIDDIFRPDSDGSKEITRRPVRVARAGVVKQVQSAAEVRFPERGEFVQFPAAPGPGKVQRIVLHDIRADQFFRTASIARRHPRWERFQRGFARWRVHL